LVATIGLILGAVYLLWMYKRVMYGQITKAENQGLKDMTGREYAYLLPIVLFIVWIGVYPKPFLKTMDASVDHLLEMVNPQTTAHLDGAKPSWLNNVFARVDLQQVAKGQGR